MASTTQAKNRNTARPKSNGNAQSRGGGATSTMKRNVVEPLQERASELKDGLTEVTRSVTGELREDWDEAREKVLDATEGARDKAREAAGRVAEVADRSQEAARRVGESVLQTIKDNPLPIALAGAGIAWLAVNLFTSSDTSPSQGDDDAPESGPRRALEPLKHAAESAATQVRGKVQKISGDAGELAQRAQSTLSTVTHDASETARRLARQASQRGKQLEQTIESTFRENPLAAGAAALALGAVIGSVLPRTRLENEWLGEKRDDVLEKGQELAQAALSKAESAVKKVANVARAATEDS